MYFNGMPLLSFIRPHRLRCISRRDFSEAYIRLYASSDLPIGKFARRAFCEAYHARFVLYKPCTGEGEWVDFSRNGRKAYYTGVPATVVRLCGVEAKQRWGDFAVGKLSLY